MVQCLNILNGKGSHVDNNYNYHLRLELIKEEKVENEISKDEDNASDSFEYDEYNYKEDLHAYN